MMPANEAPPLSSSLANMNNILGFQNKLRIHLGEINGTGFWANNCYRHPQSDMPFFRCARLWLHEELSFSSIWHKSGADHYPLSHSEGLGVW